MNGWQIVLVILGNTGFFALIQTIIQNRKDKKGLLSKILTALDQLKKQMKKQEKDNCRTQLLLLISDYPHETQEIMTLAKYYFDDLDGNWYASSIFRAWLIKNNIPDPIWFEKKLKKRETEI
jgi:hypothetical protein